MTIFLMPEAISGVMPDTQWHLADLANAATFVGGLFGLTALIVGVQTLRSGARAARLQHMHDLFKEYLKLEFEYNKAVGEDNPQRQRLRINLGSFKFYTLEEMSLWLDKERGWNWSWFWSRQRRTHIASWKATIGWHLDHSSLLDFEQMDAAGACYGDAFRAAAAESHEKLKTKQAQDEAAARQTPSGPDQPVELNPAR